MPRQQNFYYQDPSASIGASLGRALFGDPAAAAQQREQMAKAALMAAQTGEATSHGKLYANQATGQSQQNQGSTDLGAAIARLTGKMQPVPQVMPSDDLAPRPEPVAPFAPSLSDMMEIISPGARMNGDKVNLGQLSNSVGAFAGSEEMARRGMVADGHTPGKEFALTPQRADDISARDAAEGYNQATGVATINHANDMPIATMRDGTTRRGQDVTATTQRRGQDVTDKLRREVATRAAKRRSSASLSPSAYQMLFGVAADPDKLGELKRQIEGRGWAQTPDDGTLTHIRTAVSNTLDDVKGRWDRKE